MKTAFVSGSFGVLAALVLSVALPAEAATYNVAVNGSHFSPATLPIEVGDTVVWENTDAFFSHSTISDLPSSDPNYWNGWLFDEGDTFSFTFNHVTGDNGNDSIYAGGSSVSTVILGDGNNTVNLGAGDAYTFPDLFNRVLETSMYDGYGGSVPKHRHQP